MSHTSDEMGAWGQPPYIQGLKLRAFYVKSLRFFISSDASAYLGSCFVIYTCSDQFVHNRHVPQRNPTRPVWELLVVALISIKINYRYNAVATDVQLWGLEVALEKHFSRNNVEI